MLATSALGLATSDGINELLSQANRVRSHEWVVHDSPTSSQRASYRAGAQLDCILFYRVVFPIGQSVVLRETARRIFNVRAFRRPLSMAVLILMDAAALALGVLGSVYLVGEDGQAGEVARSSLPIMLALGLALFAAHD